ncbi:MAG: winged helix-turn-helix transcriptional regulator [Candidatus Thermoplasmatota archaeon]
MSEVLKQNIYRKIAKIISRHDGIQLSIIAEQMHLDIPIIEQYLSSLERNGKIFSINNEGNLLFYSCKKGMREQRTKQIRKQIFEILRRNPGLYLTQVADQLNMSVQLAEYHLRSMERTGSVQGIKTGDYYRRYYVKESNIGVQEKQIISLLRQEHLLQIVLLIMKHPNISHKELLKHVDITAGTLSHHLSHLYNCGLIEVTTYGREKGYCVKNKKEIMNIIRFHIVDVITDRFTNIWNDLNLKE